LPKAAELALLCSLCEEFANSFGMMPEKEKKEMNISIREMRSSLQQDAISSFHSAPDWCVRHIFEMRNGLPLSKIGRPRELRSLAEINARYIKPAVTSAPAANDEVERMKMRLQAIS
jgi:hypothetical protein